MTTAAIDSAVLRHWTEKASAGTVVVALYYSPARTVVVAPRHLSERIVAGSMLAARFHWSAKVGLSCPREETGLMVEQQGERCYSRAQK